MQMLTYYRNHILIFVFAFLQYANTLHHEYAWDDQIVILENPHVQEGLKGIPAFFVKQHSDYLHDKYGYRPIVQTTFAVEHELFGNNPRSGHFMNVLYFSLLCLLIYYVLIRLFFENHKILALLITLVYITHPLHVEVVANIKSRDEIFQLAFSLLTLLQFDRFYVSRQLRHLGWMILFFFLAYFSRENAITILGVIPLYLLINRQGSTRTKLKFLMPIPILIGTALLIFWLAFTSKLGVDQTSGLDIFYEHPAMGNSFALENQIGDRFANSFPLYFRYLKKFLWPFDLVYYSGLNHIPLLEGRHPIIALFFFLHVGVLIFLIKRARYFPILAFGIVFFYIGLSPFSHIFYIMPDTMADRYMFGPTLGLIMAGVCGLDYLLGYVLPASMKNAQKTFLVAIVGLFIMVGSITTFMRNKVWKNSETLVSADIGKLENCAKAQEQFADLLLDRYLQTGDQGLVPRIINRYEHAIGITEHAYYARIKLGSNFARLGDPQKGIDLLNETVALFPNQSDPHFYLGNAYYELDSMAAAIPALLMAKTLSPRNEDSYFLLAKSYLELQQFEAGKDVCLEALALFPQSYLFHDVLSDLYFEEGQPDVALEEIRKILVLQSRSEIFHKKLIGRLQQLGRMEEARQAYDRALRLGLPMRN